MSMSSRFCFFFFNDQVAGRGRSLVKYIYTIPLVAHKHAYRTLDGILPPFSLLHIFFLSSWGSKVCSGVTTNKKPRVRT